MTETIAYFWCQQKFQRSADESWRMAIQEHVSIGRQFVSVLMLGEKTIDGEAIRQNSNSTRGSLTRLCDLGCCPSPFSDLRKQVKFNRSPERFSFLVGIDRVKKQRWRRGMSSHITSFRRMGDENNEVCCYGFVLGYMLFNGEILSNPFRGVVGTPADFVKMRVSSVKIRPR